MAYKEHCDKCARRKDRGIGEEGLHTEAVHKESGYKGSDRLRRHTCGVVKSGVFSDVAAASKLDDHREGVDIDGCPSDTRNGKEDHHNGQGSTRVKEGCGEERAREHNDAREDRLFSADYVRYS